MRTTLVAVAFSSVIVLAGTVHAQALCGNGVVEAPELCDDGNLDDADGCDSNCTPTGCGNGIVTAPEECDDGNLTDGDCCSATCLDENQPPDCSDATASVDELWPPNHKLAPVVVGGVTDPDGDDLAVAVTAIAQDEPLDATGDGATCPDALGLGTDTASVRSERSGHGDGRVYHIAFEAVDRCAATCAGEVTVCVRHDRRPHGTCGDGGPLYDSTAGLVTPCEGEECGPEACVPDPEDVDECTSESVPDAIVMRMDKAQKLLARATTARRGKKLGRGAARQLASAARRAAKAARRGALSVECAAALDGALDVAGDCAVCTVQ